MLSVMEDPVPFQVQLERRQHRQLKWLAERRGASMATLIRESVGAYLDALPTEDEPLYGLIGFFPVDDGPTPHGDVARNHDAYLADLHEAEAEAEAEPEAHRRAP